MANQIENHFLEVVGMEFRKYKKMGDECIQRLSENELHQLPQAECNSMALIIKHLSGNMISRWSDFLTTDGEKPNRHRDTEFEEGKETKEELITIWEKGWAVFLNTFDTLKPENLMQNVFIRGEAHTVLNAINRQTAHYAFHVGQMVFMAKIILGKEWKSLSIPEGKSEEFNKGFKI
ncbi:MAG: DUF1572 family protein [Bacteroidetes bacterium]|nr:DUF1572 family protein [Bacteroidota bacterium]